MESSKPLFQPFYLVTINQNIPTMNENVVHPLVNRITSTSDFLLTNINLIRRLIRRNEISNQKNNEPRRLYRETGDVGEAPFPEPRKARPTTAAVASLLGGREAAGLSSKSDPSAFSSAHPIFSNFASNSRFLYPFTILSSSSEVDTPGVRRVGTNFPSDLTSP